MMYFRAGKGIVFGLAASLVICGRLGAELSIAVEGKSRAVIVVAKDASEAEKHAADELALFLKQVTGGDFPVVDHAAGTHSRLLVGPGAAGMADRNFSTQELGSDGIVLRTIGPDLILAGGRPRGTLYAVYTFLEDVVGCRWWAPGESTIPRKPTLKVPALDVRHMPVMEFREPYWGVHLADGDWCARNKVNGGRVQADAKRGGSITEIGSVHSFYVDIPPAKYFKDHPDWFSEIQGKRTSDNAQLCMTNAGLLAEYVRLVKENIRGHAGVNSVWVSQNDWDGHCECAKCKEINDREGTPAGALITFVNAVADAVGEDYPDVAVRTLAYDWSQKPPKTLQPRQNVGIWLCTTGCKYNVPLTHEWNKTFREALDGWSKVCDRIYIWDYVSNYSAYLCPHPILRTLGPNARYYADHGVRGVFYQGAYSAPHAEMAELRAWVQAKLLWNPYGDAGKLIDEFLDGYYGPAGKHIRSYLNVFHDAIERTGESVYMCEQPMGKKWLTLKTLSEGMAHLKAAKTAAAGNKDLERRVEIAELPLQYVYLLRWDELAEQARAEKNAWPFAGKEIKPVYDRFQAARKKYGITQLSEQNARDWFAVVEERVAVGKALVPPGCEKLPRDRWVDLQDVGLTRNQYVTTVVKDESASDGSAIRLPADSDDKLINKQLWRVPLVSVAAEAKRPVRVFLSVRCDVNGREGGVFKCGVDGKERVLEVKAADVPDNRYHTYELGKFDSLSGWIHLWVAPVKNPENVKGIYLDRIWMVRDN